MVYFIRAGEAEDDELPEGVIGAAATHPVVRAGNQLVLTFADSPSVTPRRLFVTQRTLDDVPAQAPVPIPSPTSAPSPTPLPTATRPTAALERSYGDDPNLGLESPISPVSFIVPGVLLPLALIAGVVAIRMLRSQRHASR
jgi:hypothetical protein